MATNVKKAAKTAPKKPAKPVAKKAVAKKAEPKKPAVKAVAKKPAKVAPAKKAAAKTPVKKVTAKAPAKKVAAKAPAKKVAAKAPAKKVVAKAPAKKVVAKAPAKKVVAKAPAKKVVAKAPAKKVVAKAPAKKVVAKAPVKKVVTKAPVEKPVQPAVQAPAKETPKVAVPSVRYSDEDLQMFKKVILEKLAKAKDDYEMLRSAITHRTSNGVEDTSPSFQVIEEGAFSLSKEESSQLANRQYKFIQNLEAALVRIENKTYGISRVTGKLIPKARLLLVPHATTNVEDKQNR